LSGESWCCQRCFESKQAGANSCPILRRTEFCLSIAAKRRERQKLVIKIPLGVGNREKTKRPRDLRIDPELLDHRRLPA
jgi:hypothetical protein